MNSRTPIYFVFPYRGVGGVSILFLRLAHKIAAETEHRCVLVDYADGYMAQNANLELVEVLYYSDKTECLIAGDAVVLFQSMTPWSILPNLNIARDTSVLFWNCHPMNFAVQMPGLRHFSLKENSWISKISRLLLISYRKKIASFVSYLNANDGIVFMDGPNYLGTLNHSGVTIGNPVYVPIPAPSKKLINRDFHSDNATLHFCWIGRIVDFKFFILKRLIEDLSDISSLGLYKIPITLSVVGAGSHQPKLLQYGRKKKDLLINFVDHMSENEVNSFLTRDVDILAAMGTSALEGAKYGIPTILLDFSYKTVNENYSYSWLFQRDGFTLGDDLADIKLSGNSVESLDLLISDFLTDGAAISSKTHSYFNANHSIDVVAKKLLSALGKSSVKWGNLQKAGFVTPGLVYQIFRTLKRHVNR